MKLNYIHSESVPNGTKFVAFFDDGSGASLFMIDDDGDLYDAELYRFGPAPDIYLIGAGYSYWIELPNTFKFWFEQKEEKRP